MEVPHASPIRFPATKHVCGRTHVNNAFSFPPLQVGLLDFRQVSLPRRPPVLLAYYYKQVPLQLLLLLLLLLLLFHYYYKYNYNCHCVTHTHTSVVPYTNLPLPGQASQDLATSTAPIHKSSAAQLCQA